MTTTVPPPRHQVSVVVTIDGIPKIFTTALGPTTNVDTRAGLRALLHTAVAAADTALADPGCTYWDSNPQTPATATATVELHDGRVVAESTVHVRDRGLLLHRARVKDLLDVIPYDRTGLPPDPQPASVVFDLLAHLGWAPEDPDQTSVDTAIPVRAMW